MADCEYLKYVHGDEDFKCNNPNSIHYGEWINCNDCKSCKERADSD